MFYAGLPLIPEAFSFRGQSSQFFSAPHWQIFDLNIFSFLKERTFPMATTLPPPQEPPTLSNEEVLRYSRHLIMPEVGMEGQKKLKAARVLCIGTGGLGSPLALYLSAAGVGTIGLVDFDVVDFTNLQRQVIHFTSDVGKPKLESAKEKIAALNPFVNVKN